MIQTGPRSTKSWPRPAAAKTSFAGLLDFSRQRKPEMITNDVHSVLEDCVSLVENQALFHNIQILKAFDPAVPLVVFDPSQIERVFINLIINAAEAMEPGGTLRIETHPLPEKGRIEIQFRDTGHGIKPANLENIFDPFFTTKDVGHGTGLGLAISYGIVKEHQGQIFVESEVGSGTTFFVRLPAVFERVKV